MFKPSAKVSIMDPIMLFVSQEKSEEIVLWHCAVSAIQKDSSDHRDRGNIRKCLDNCAHDMKSFSSF